MSRPPLNLPARRCDLLSTIGSLAPLGRRGQLWFASGSFAFTLLERMLILYLPFFYLPPDELGLEPLLSTTTHWGLLTALGGALLWGRVVDGLADPLIAHLSDNHRSHKGRRRIFMLYSSVPLALASALVFFPPSASAATVNGLWLALTLGVFYVSYTAYVNPYLALISELGQGNEGRIDLSTFIALFGLVGMGLITMILPALAGHLELGGMDMRRAYQMVVSVFCLLGAVFLYIPTRSFREIPQSPSTLPLDMGVWQSLRRTLAFRPFRIFVLGEVGLQFAMNILTLGLLYYTVVLFRREPEFLTVLASVTMGTALLSFPLINVLAKRLGKKRVITNGLLIFVVVSLAMYLSAATAGGVSFYPVLFLFGLAGIPLAVLVILVNPTIVDMARADALQNGMAREAMFFAARAIPLKLSIAAAGVVFGYLLSLGKDIANPRGIHLSLLVVSIAALGAYVAFRNYPEEEVQAMITDETSCPQETSNGAL